MTRWEPEYLHTLFPSQRVVLPQRDEECEDAKTGDPLLSASFCGQGSTVLKKWMSEELAQAEPDLLQLFEGWELNNGDLERLVSLENSAGGYYTIEEAACVALKTERTRAKWETWINIESPCAWKGKDYKWSEEANSCVANKPPDLTPVVTSAIIIGVILAAITVGVSLRHKQLKRYVEKLETECVADGVVDYVTPISEAIRILKVSLHSFPVCGACSQAQCTSRPIVTNLSIIVCTITSNAIFAFLLTHPSAFYGHNYGMFCILSLFIIFVHDRQSYSPTFSKSHGTFMLISVVIRFLLWFLIDSDCWAPDCCNHAESQAGLET
jgi:hypothetical protein